MNHTVRGGQTRAFEFLRTGLRGGQLFYVAARLQWNNRWLRDESWENSYPDRYTCPTSNPESDIDTMADEYGNPSGPDGKPGAQPNNGWTNVPQQQIPQQQVPQQPYSTQAGPAQARPPQYPPQPNAVPGHPPQQPYAPYGQPGGQGQGYAQAGAPPSPYAASGQQQRPGAPGYPQPQAYPGYPPGAPRAAGTSSKLPLILGIGAAVAVLGIGLVIVMAVVIGGAHSAFSSSGDGASSSSSAGSIFGNSNPIIGSWKIVPDPAMSGCEDTVTFTDTTQTVAGGRFGTSTSNVTYIVQEKRVAVVGNLGLGHASIYELMDNGQIRIFAYNGYCVYEKA